MIKIVLAKAAKVLIPAAVVLARLILDQGLTEMERTFQSALRKGAESFLAAHPQP